MNLDKNKFWQLKLLIFSSYNIDFTKLDYHIGQKNPSFWDKTTMDKIWSVS